MQDAVSTPRLALCHPEVARRVEAADAALAKQGIAIRVAEGVRSYADSDADYAKGRTQPGHIVTNAPGGFSWHNFGMAVDCYPFLHGCTGDLDWNANDLHFHAMVEAMQAEDLDWGGEWHSIKDPPHFQLRELPVSPSQTDRNAFTKGGLQRVWGAVHAPEPDARPHQRLGGGAGQRPRRPFRPDVLARTLLGSTGRHAAIPQLAGKEKAVTHTLAILAGIYVLLAAAQAMPPPTAAGSAGLYGFFYRFVQILAVNLHRLGENRFPGMISASAERPARAGFLLWAARFWIGLASIIVVLLAVAAVVFPLWSWSTTAMLLVLGVPVSLYLLCDGLHLLLARRHTARVGGVVSAALYGDKHDEPETFFPAQPTYAANLTAAFAATTSIAAPAAGVSMSSFITSAQHAVATALHDVVVGAKFVGKAVAKAEAVAVKDAPAIEQLTAMVDPRAAQIERIGAAVLGTLEPQIVTASNQVATAADHMSQQSARRRLRFRCRSSWSRTSRRCSRRSRPRSPRQRSRSSP